jgi:hypothetical protein
MKESFGRQYWRNAREHQSSGSSRRFLAGALAPLGLRNSLAGRNIPLLHRGALPERAAMDTRVWQTVVTSAVLCLASACGGGGSDMLSGPPSASASLTRVSQPSTFPANCDGVAASGTLYVGAAVEPYLAVNPTSPANVIGTWQQNRWSSGGSQGLMFGASFDGGATWRLSQAATSRCTGGDPGNGGDYARASDPWITFSADGTAYALSLSFTGATLAPGSVSAMLVARSAGGGTTWTAPTTLIRDGANFFNDKGTITADPADAHFVYAVWDRIDATQRAPTSFAMTSNAGATWQAARSIYDPGPGNQTLGNQIVILPGGTLVDVFTEIDTSPTGALASSIRAIQSHDHGTHWTAPIKIADLLAVGASDPQTHAPIRDGSDLAAVTADASGTVYVTWQDARFSSGHRDGIALSRSTDGAVTWSAPLQVNAVPATQAFTPAVRVTVDGIIALTYFDFRNDTPDPNTLLTDCWLITSTDAMNWTESHISGPFDLDLAAISDGHFLGDYQGLASTGTQLLPFLVQPSGDGQIGHTDVFVAMPADMMNTSQASRPSAAGTPIIAASAAPFVVTAEWRERLQQRVVRTLEQRSGSRSQ